MKKSGKTRKQKETHPQTYQTKRKTHLKATLKYAGAFLYFAETAVQPLVVQTSSTKPPPILLANQQKKKHELKCKYCGDLPLKLQT